VTLVVGHDRHGALVVLVDGAVWPWARFVASRRTALLLPGVADRAEREVLAALVGRDVLETLAAPEGAA
jgi:hypothetical protein